MQNELEKAKQHADINLHPALTNIGVTPVHEDEQHQKISSAIQAIHPEAGTSKDAVVPSVEPTPNLVRIPKEPTGSPMADPSFGLFYMAKKLGEKLRLKAAKGELPNAA